MNAATDVSAHDSAEALEFLRKTGPFNDLDGETLVDLSRRLTTKFFAKDTVVFRQDVDEVDHLYLIYAGGVKTYLAGPEESMTLLDFRGEGGSFGALALIRGSKANFNVETVEDTWCFVLDKEAFRDLIHHYPRFSGYYLKTLSDDLVGTAYAELRSRKVAARPQEMLYLFNLTVGEVISRAPEIIHASEPIQRAAERMSDLEIGSLLVEDPSGDLVGIITDKDLRRKVVAKAHDYYSPISDVMSSPVKTVQSNALCFDALLAMMNQRVRHLAVERGSQIVGVVSVHDIMVQQGASPLHLYREIGNQRTIEGLYSLSRRIPRVVRALIEEGARANNITRVITVLNDQIVDRLLGMLVEEIGPPPVPFCWITFGSEGRKEQTFKTDQDNALIYDTPIEDEAHLKAARAYFRHFGQEAARHLEACGYPLCKGKMMASNPRWRKMYPVWKDYFDNWMTTPEPSEVLNAMIFFDFRTVFGQIGLGDALREYLVATAPDRSFFLMNLARDCIAAKTPLTFFKNFMVEKDGRYKNRLDVKTQGLTPFVNFARLLALRHGVKETNTLARLDLLAEKECIPRQLYLEARDAYEFQMQLRLINQLRMIEANEEPSNYIDPGELSDVEKETLREAFAAIGRIQTYVKGEFRVLE